MAAAAAQRALEVLSEDEPRLRSKLNGGQCEASTNDDEHMEDQQEEVAPQENGDMWLHTKSCKNWQITTHRTYTSPVSLDPVCRFVAMFFNKFEYNIKFCGFCSLKSVQNIKSRMFQTEKLVNFHSWVNSGVSTSKMRVAAATALSAAAVKAKLMAEQEEREIQRLIVTVVDSQLKKLEIKLKYSEDLDKASIALLH